MVLRSETRAELGQFWDEMPISFEPMKKFFTLNTRKYVKTELHSRQNTRLLNDPTASLFYVPTGINLVGIMLLSW